jgi:hypothetical protein
MAYIARWQVDARFGHKQSLIDKLAEWTRDIAPRAGFPAGRSRMLTGSIGALEATVEHEWEIQDLAELERAWAAMARMPEHATWGAELEQHVVSGTSRWTILRLL